MNRIKKIQKKTRGMKKKSDEKNEKKNKSIVTQCQNTRKSKSKKKQRSRKTEII